MERFAAEILVHRDYLTRCAMVLTGDRDSAGDLVQETLLRAWTYFDTLKPGTHPRSWLYRIMRNTFINEYRRSRRQPEQVEFDEQQITMSSRDDGRDASGDVNTRIERGTVGDEILQAVESLPLKIRNVLMLRHFEDFQYEEIAEALRIPIGTVRSRLNRARQVLSSRLKEYARSHGYPEDTHPRDGNLVLARS